MKRYCIISGITGSFACTRLPSKLAQEAVRICPLEGWPVHTSQALLLGAAGPLSPLRPCRVLSISRSWPDRCLQSFCTRALYSGIFAGIPCPVVRRRLYLLEFASWFQPRLARRMGWSSFPGRSQREQGKKKAGKQKHQEFSRSLAVTIFAFDYHTYPAIRSRAPQSRQDSSAFVHEAVLQHTSFSSLFSWFVVVRRTVFYS